MSVHTPPVTSPTTPPARRKQQPAPEMKFACNKKTELKHGADSVTFSGATFARINLPHHQPHPPVPPQQPQAHVQNPGGNQPAAGQPQQNQPAQQPQAVPGGNDQAAAQAHQPQGGGVPPQQPPHFAGMLHKLLGRK